ncbi:MAG: hypothetical protein KC493_09675 [Bacteriovoracaceae bacterium]|nr:hypothetical protein [Bacteriovoracaceae bacterium]
MGKRSCYIKEVSGFFPDASSVDIFWKNLLRADTAQSVSLSDYWNEKSESYSDDSSDGHIYMDSGHIANYPFGSKSHPRQIQAGIDVVSNILSQSKTKYDPKDVSLIIASEWTDHSFYEEQLGNIPSGEGYSVEKQIDTIKNETGVGGVALAVDTACASSLYGLELARGLLESGFSKHVIVLGLNMYLHSFLYRGFSKLGALSRKGCLTSFDSEADGIVPGESACGILIDQDYIGAISEIDGIGLSTDGNEGSPFSPGFQGQLNAYKRAFDDGEVESEQVDYLEAHGTATLLGDQTEISSIQKYFERKKGSEIIVGACKSNIGHTLAASGLASIIKASLIIQNKMMPPHIEINKNPLLDQKGIRILDRRKKINKTKVAVGVSSFGFGGSNAHVILKTPEKNSLREKKQMSKTVFIRNMMFDKKPVSDYPSAILKNVPMGPRMQERIDPFQRSSLSIIQKLLLKSQLTTEEQSDLSCICLNNLGGKLSLDFEKKYRKGLGGPELSIEAVASTLPSMLSGYPALLFNMRGHHMLLSSSNYGLSDLLGLCPYLLEKSEGDIIIEVARKNFDSSSCEEGMGAFLISREENETRPWLAKFELTSRMSNPSKCIDMVEASGLKELVETIESGPGEYNLSMGYYNFKVNVNDIGINDDDILAEILNESLLNKSIALDYLNMISHFHETPESIVTPKYGDFIVNCEKSGNRSSAELVVDDGHPYFFDHPLDHVPGILMIHACEELLEWHVGSSYLATKMNIRFTRFLEKDGKTTVKLTEKETGKFNFEILQKDVPVCLLKIEVQFQNPGIILGEVSSKIISIEDKKYTHKHKSENILVSALDSNDRFCSQSRDLSAAGNKFFHHLLGKRQSLLYFGEVTRQFVMLMAHLEKQIPLDMKMNLISIDLDITKWVKPPFDMKLNKFEMIDSDKFMLADVKINFLNKDRIFGSGSLKAQVVTKEYYTKQRG